MMKNIDLLKELIESLGLEICPDYPTDPGRYNIGAFRDGATCARAIIDEWYYLRFIHWDFTLICRADPKLRRYNPMDETYPSSTLVFKVNLADPNSLDVVRSKVERWLKSHSLILAACGGKLWN